MLLYLFIHAEPLLCSLNFVEPLSLLHTDSSRIYLITLKLKANTQTFLMILKPTTVLSNNMSLCFLKLLFGDNSRDLFSKFCKSEASLNLQSLVVPKLKINSVDLNVQRTGTYCYCLAFLLPNRANDR